ncbi:unnamed protein product [Bursaphelenchus xylophilus]|uniref:(pine wood nematode) hypothetical protein n=1 Tax=Bursaphelenchus xylophilus TaxID=6326 RepID=A0A1I7S920_BURXY|nr:unnamed protein product [Bursaphelenchus xylophilus]CAG9086156.1 unnamed protein product [Bursaphelenchus xylophilus]
MWKVTAILFCLKFVQSFEIQPSRSGIKPSVPPRFYSVSDAKHDDYDEYHPTLEMWTKAVVRQRNERAMLIPSHNYFDINRQAVPSFDGSPWSNDFRRLPMPYQSQGLPNGLEIPVPRMSPTIRSLSDISDVKTPLERPTNDKIVTMEQLSPKPYSPLNQWPGPDVIDGFNFKALRALRNE